MIRAAADHAEGKSPPPRELILALQARSWGALPEPGGLLDQPAGLLERMTAVYNVWSATRSWHQRQPGKEKDWKTAHPDEWDVVMAVQKLRRGEEA
jgi:hypothetical protein